jgi:hypothetical protein
MEEKSEPEKGFQRLKAENIERLKEIAAINKTTGILKAGKPIDESLQQIALILPPAYQYPAFTTARIIYEGEEYRSSDFKKTEWVQRQEFETIDNQKGMIEVFYLKEYPKLDEGPFLEEERHLIFNIANLISGFLNSVKGKRFLNRTFLTQKVESEETEESIQPAPTSRKLLQKFLNKSNINRDIYHDLMPFKVKEILLVANLYDAYSIEKEGKFSEHVLGEYHQLNLTSVPRITGVSSSEEAFEQLNSKHFDLIILMVGANKNQTLSLSEKVKKNFPYIPVFLLLNNNSDIAFFEKKTKYSVYIDRTFVWNGDSRIFFSMIKLVEDMINVENDSQRGLVRVILLVEDSPKYYSKYLPLLYQIVMEQTKRIIQDVSTDELYKVLRMRARPKILLATTYEGAQNIINKYEDNLLCLITDVSFDKNNIQDKDAGFELAKYVRGKIKNLPIIIQSSELSNSKRTYELKATFIDKFSETLMQDFQSFITYHLGFGNFIYRDKKGSQIGVARSLKEFENQLRTIPDESIIYHAKRDHFSLWLMARGEIHAAKILNPRKVSDFQSPQKLRETLIQVIQKFRNEQNKGKIIPFDENAVLDETNILNLSDGSLGGKGRGLAFINTLIYNYNFGKHIPEINIKTPKTSVIGTDEFEYFLERNHLRDFVANEKNYDVIKRRFMLCQLTDTLYKRLKIILRKIKNPIAIRSSGLFEDSLMQPFAGIFETYLLPNNHLDIGVRIDQVMNAIKLVFASVYSPVARGYIEAVNYKLEEEKMAVILQEVVGNRYGDYYYPHISGVAQSYNYYPFAHMKPEEGFAVAAVGLGKYVVEGEKAYRFSPQYPGTEINTPKDQFLNSQTKFFAVDLNKKNLNLLEGDTAGLSYLDIDDAEIHGNMKHCASVFDADNNVIYPGISKSGPRIVNFANILKYNYIPLAKTIDTVLDVVKEAMGSPVEIEFAVDINKDKNGKATFYLLQIKPMIGNVSDYSIEMDEINKKDILLYTERGMGNGKIENITDVIYVDTQKFDKSKTIEMVDEIELLNKKMCQENRKYVLIGPGRWGTRDRFIGIPVRWPQISKAKVIVETSLENFPLDASSGSHFFHNVTSMNVGYFSVIQEQSGSYINWNKLDNQEIIETSTYFRHIRFKKPIVVKMDGKKRISVITINND